MQKHSRQRDAVAAALCRMGNHPTAAQVFDEVRKEYPRISLATVYRHLSQLVAQGQALPVTTEDGALRYDGTLTTHAHLICRECGAVVDVETPMPFDRLPPDVTVERMSLVFYGVCAVCKNKSH